MSTLSKNLADVIVANNGMYPGDCLRVVKIVKYSNAFNGEDAYGAIYEGRDPDTYAASQYVGSPEVYWEYEAPASAAPSKFTPQQLEDWKAYEEVRSWGDYNMFSTEARYATALTKDAYMFVMKNYTALKAAVAAAI